MRWMSRVPKKVFGVLAVLLARLGPAAGWGPSVPVAWSIAGSDSGGGAGIQADLLTFHDIGCHGCCVPTALTAQSSVGVSRVEYSSDAMIEETISTLEKDMAARAVKTGMLGKQSVMEVVQRFLGRYKGHVVCDPVMVSTSGSRLLEEDAIKSMVKNIFPGVDVITPNRQETEVLLQRSIDSPEDVENAAEELLKMGPKAVLIKGGHFDTNEGVSADFFKASSVFTAAAGEVEQLWIFSERIDTEHTHGTGCTLSAAICAFLAKGHTLLDAVILGKGYVTKGIRRSKEIGPIGSGPGPVQHGGAELTSDDFPTASTKWSTPSRVSAPFPRLKSAISVLPVVPNASWVERLAMAGAKDIQLRTKNMSEEDARAEAAAAAKACAKMGCHLWINDNWRLAKDVSAYGVHLGQEDLDEVCQCDAELEGLTKSGLRLGISTHCHSELAVALTMRPSYISLGPVFGTQSKMVQFGERGVEMVDEWRRLVPEDIPLIVIGGITLEGATGVQQVCLRGAQGVAVISAITNSPVPEASLRSFMRAVGTATRELSPSP